MFNTRKELQLLGDFNMDMYRKSEEGRFLNHKEADFSQRFCLVNKITEQTRVTHKTITLIDVALTSHPERYAYLNLTYNGKKSFSYVICQLWNKLPLIVRQAGNLNDFKQKRMNVEL